MTTLVADTGLSLSEAARRMGWQDAAVPLLPTVQTLLGPTFGGTWFDLETGRLKIGISTTGILPVPTSLEILRVARLTTVTDIVPVEWPLGTLERTLSELLPEFDRVNSGGVPSVLIISMRTDLNAVQLEVPTESITPAQQQFVEFSQDRYGSRIVVVPFEGSGYATADRCNGGAAYCDPPLRAGVAISASLAGACSLGFLVRDRSTNALYALTAGHCVDGGPPRA